MADTEPQPAEPPGKRIALPLPSSRVLKLAAVVCFVLDFALILIGVGDRLNFTALGLALYMAAEVV